MKKDYINTTSENIANSNLEKLKNIFPNFVKDNKIDFDSLKKFFEKENIDDNGEKYGLSWAGKGNAIKSIKTNATGTLIKDEKESKDFDNTKNIFIEGDNLEVLKLLQKNYREKIKMIYIDPPYNTGKDFVYHDNFTSAVADYYEMTGQTEGGIKMSTNTEKNGRYHSDWLTMMYPRLFLARNLLKEDGVIFVSIDDNEVANLRMIMDEIFGEENFVETFIWKKKGGASNTETIVGDIFEYILLYSKNKNKVVTNRREIDSKQFSYQDEEGFYFLQSLLKTDSGMYQRDTMKYGVVNPKNGEITYPMKGKRWTVGEKTMNELLKNNLLEFLVNKDGIKDVRKKEYFIENDPQTGVYLNLLLEKGSLKSAKTELENLNFTRETFDTPKPDLLLKHLMEIVTKKDDEEIILDFFAGSGTTGHAVMDLNAEDGGNRKFILVQLPEMTDEKSEAYKAGYKKISEITRERLIRAGEKIKKDYSLRNDFKDLAASLNKTLKNKDKKVEMVEGENKFDLKNIDLGFKAYKLSKSNYRKWNVITGEGSEENLKNLKDQMKIFTEKPLVDNYDEIDVVYEIILKEGFSLNSKIENGEGKLKPYIVMDENKDNEEENGEENKKRLVITFAKKVLQEDVDKLELKANDTFVCFDSALDDSTKVNVGRGVNVKVI